MQYFAQSILDQILNVYYIFINVFLTSLFVKNQEFLFKIHVYTTVLFLLSLNYCMLSI